MSLGFQVVACGKEDSATGVNEECDLNELERNLVDQTMTKLLNDGTWVVTQSHDSHVGVAQSLVGVDEGYLASASLVFPCTEATWYDPYCDNGGLPEGEDGFWSGKNQCSRLGCEAADINLVQIYFVEQPNMLPDEQHSFSYATSNPAGTAVADPNPLVTWRIDGTSDDTRRVTASIDRALTITPTGGNPVNLDHTAEFDATSAETALVSATIEMTFPSLSDTPVVIDASIDAAGEISGSVMKDGEVIGQVQDVTETSHIAWTGACGSE